MSSFYIDKDFVVGIPSHVRKQFNQLPYELKTFFDNQYRVHSKNMAVAYVLLWFVGAPYAYRNQWVKQIFFWVTFGGMGFWFFYSFAILWHRIRQDNHRYAENLIGNCLMRMTSSSPESIIATTKSRKSSAPRELDIPYNPASLSIDNLQKGFLVDFQARTWEVERYWQQDWNNGKSDRFYMLLYKHEQVFITSLYEGFLNSYFCSRFVNIHIIDPQLENMIYSNQPLKNVINYGGDNYYKETKLEGILFDLTKEDNPLEIRQWDYYTENRRQSISITQGEDGSITVYAGYKVNITDFTDILPRT
ncbi:MAG: TM2 domain-containing protein [Cytophagales bacterium]|nr:TM2 domain-containing protein [Cytophagales bacterium]